MKFIVITLFPEMFTGVLGSSILGRAQESGAIDFEALNLRDFGVGPRKQVDDTPYGGGAGMVLRVDVMAAALASAKARVKSNNYKVLLMTPQGERITQPTLRQMADYDGDYIVICGHYEGYDERIRGLVDEELSVGDYVLTGGELPAMIVVDGVSRLLPGVLGREESHQDESHSVEGRVEYPHYTRPDSWEDVSVPEILKSGNHAKIADWRNLQSQARSKK